MTATATRSSRNDAAPDVILAGVRFASGSAAREEAIALLFAGQVAGYRLPEMVQAFGRATATLAEYYADAGAEVNNTGQPAESAAREQARTELVLSAGRGDRLERPSARAVALAERHAAAERDLELVRMAWEDAGQRLVASIDADQLVPLLEAALATVLEAAGPAAAIVRDAGMPDPAAMLAAPSTSAAAYAELVTLAARFDAVHGAAFALWRLERSDALVMDWGRRPGSPIQLRLAEQFFDPAEAGEPGGSFELGTVDTANGPRRRVARVADASLAGGRDAVARLVEAATAAGGAS